MTMEISIPGKMVFILRQGQGVKITGVSSLI